METVTDYSNCSQQELTDAARYIDREKYPNQYKQVVQELERHGGPPPAPPAEKEEWDRTIPSMLRFFSHGLAGFAIGETAYVFLAIFLMTINHVLAFLSFHWLLYGLAIPLLCTVYGFVRAVRRPVAWLSRPGVIFGLLLWATLPPVLVAGAVWIVWSAFVGFC